MDAKKKKDSQPQKVVESESAKALKVFRIDDVSASIFVRERFVRDENRQFYSVTFSRSYKDSKDSGGTRSGSTWTTSGKL